MLKLTKQDVVGRLLTFQASFVKDHYNQTGKTADILEAVAPGETQTTLANFVKLHYILCKQHIYFFNLGRAFDTNRMGTFPFNIEHDEVVNGDRILVFFPITSYQVVLQDPLENKNLSFVHPFILRISGRTLTIHFIKLEKTVKHYFPANRRAFKSTQTNTEQDIFASIVSFLIQEFNASPLDLNRGVKHLWSTGQIDSPKITRLESSSTDTSVMHGSLLFRGQYPTKFAEAMLQPVEDTIFVSQRNDENYPAQFSTDPSRGKLSIPTFPKTTNQVLNVVRAILANN